MNKTTKKPTFKKPGFVSGENITKSKSKPGVVTYQKLPDVVIIVEGGVVQEAYARNQLDVVLIDHDNLKAEGKTLKEREKIVKDTMKGLKGQPLIIL